MIIFMQFVTILHQWHAQHMHFHLVYAAWVVWAMFHKRKTKGERTRNNDLPSRLTIVHISKLHTVVEE